MQISKVLCDQRASLGFNKYFVCFVPLLFLQASVALANVPKVSLNGANPCSVLLESPHSLVEEAVTSDWASLHDDGVRLDDESIDFIVNTVEAGHLAALKFFHLPIPKKGMKFIVSADHGDSPTYVVGSGGIINLPVDYFNSFADLPVKGKALGELHTEHDLAAVPPSLEEYLFAIGIEETIHYLQDIGFAETHARLSPKIATDQFQRLDYLMTSVEVEARSLTDKILLSLRKRPYWVAVDDYLKAQYPDKYGKTDLE